jgi:hypothetical protein
MVALIIGIFFYNSAKSNSAVEKGIFQIENLNQIDRVVLESKKEKTELKFNGNKWTVNGQEADRQMITILFAALKQVEAKRAVAAAIQDSIKREVNSSGIKVSCYEGQILEKEFWSKGTQQKSETYFQLSNGEPYVVTIPGYRVYVASVFEVSTADWRDKTVFNFNWQNIKSVEVMFPKDGKQNFKASFQNKIFSIENLNQTDTTKLATFMDALIQLRAEKIVGTEQSTKYDSLLSLDPIETINVQDIANRNYELKIFPYQKKLQFVVAKRGDEVMELSPLAIVDVFKKRDHFISRSH